MKKEHGVLMSISSKFLGMLPEAKEVTVTSKWVNKDTGKSGTYKIKLDLTLYGGSIQKALSELNRISALQVGNSGLTYHYF